MRVAVKYCGSCNPHVDLSRVAHHLVQLAGQHQDLELVSLDPDNLDMVVILCGCPRACGDKAEVRARAGLCLLVAGESVNRKPVAEAELPRAVEQELVRILRAARSSPAAEAH